MTWLSGVLRATGWSLLFLQGRYMDDEKALPDVKRRGVAVIEKSFTSIERELAGREFAVGDGLTAVNYYPYQFLRCGKSRGFDLAPYQTYAAHMKMIGGLGETKKVLAVEGLPPCFE